MEIYQPKSLVDNNDDDNGGRRGDNDDDKDDVDIAVLVL